MQTQLQKLTKHSEGIGSALLAKMLVLQAKQTLVQVLGQTCHGYYDVQLPDGSKCYALHQDHLQFPYVARKTHDACGIERFSLLCNGELLADCICWADAVKLADKLNAAEVRA